MALARLSICDQVVEVELAAIEQRRLEDLALSLGERLAAMAAAMGGRARCEQVLAAAALALLDESQRAGAAAARAHCEIDRLHDALAAAFSEPACAKAERA